MSSPNQAETMTVRRAVAQNIARLRRARGWSQKELAERVEAAGGSISDKTLSRLEQTERKVSEDGQATRTADLKVQDMLDIARVLGVSPLTLLAPPNRARVQASTRKSSLVLSGRRFRAWLVGRTPLDDDANDQYFTNLPDSLEQTEEWHELQALAAEAVWAAQDPDMGYGEAMHHQQELKQRLDLLFKQLEITTRRRDPEGAEKFDRRMAAAGPRGRTTEEGAKRGS